MVSSHEVSASPPRPTGVGAEVVAATILSASLCCAVVAWLLLRNPPSGKARRAARWTAAILVPFLLSSLFSVALIWANFDGRCLQPSGRLEPCSFAQYFESTSLASSLVAAISILLYFVLFLPLLTLLLRRARRSRILT